MAQLSDIKIKQLTASGAVTTDGVAGILLYCYVSGDTAGDKVDIKDGTTKKITLLVPSNNGAAEPFVPPKGEEPKFTTDIDCVITTSNNVYATFIYREIS